MRPLEDEVTTATTTTFESWTLVPGAGGVMRSDLTDIPPELPPVPALPPAPPAPPAPPVPDGSLRHPAAAIVARQISEAQIDLIMFEALQPVSRLRPAA